MAIYYAPGVYIEEPDRGPKPIEGVSTSVTAFIGYTEKAEADVENKKPMRKSILSEAKTITNWNQYLDHFGGLVEGAYLPYAVRGFFENGGTRCYVISVKTLGDAHRAQALLETQHSVTKQNVPFLFARAMVGGPKGENIEVKLEKKKNGSGTLSDPIKFDVSVGGTIIAESVQLSYFPHWGLQNADMQVIERTLRTMTSAVKVDELDQLEEKVREKLKKATAKAKELAEFEKQLNLANAADKAKAAEEARKYYDAITQQANYAKEKAKRLAEQANEAAVDAQAKSKSAADALADAKAKTDAAEASQAAEDAKIKAEEASEAAKKAKTASELADKASEEVKRHANNVAEAQGQLQAAEKASHAANTLKEKLAETAKAQQSAREAEEKARKAQELLDMMQQKATEADNALKEAEKGTDDTKKEEPRKNKAKADEDVKNSQSALDKATASATKAREFADAKAKEVKDLAESKYQDAKAEADIAKQEADREAERFAKVNQFDATFKRILGRGYESDTLNDPTHFSAIRKLQIKLDEQQVEIWRGVETDRPVKLAFKESNSEILKITGSVFNVDGDDKLIIAQEDRSERDAAQQSGVRFDVVRPEQYRGYARKGLSALEELDDVNLICAPDIMSLPNESQVLTVQKMMIEHCERMQFRFAILDSPHGKDVDGIKQWRMDAGFDPQHGHAALYYPWIKIDDPLNPGRKLAIPPSGHIAGIYARSDAQRGVYKAPANENVNGVIDLDYIVNQAEQGMLNPIGINCIRKFPGRGIKVWGARTLALTDPSWRYVNVRRLFNFVEASIERATQWVVFEPNDPILWGKIRRDVNAFMRTVWLSGALFGNTPDEAFYVKCDEELNPSETRDQGYLFVEIGMAPVKPAEFVVFRISQWAGPNAEG